MARLREELEQREKLDNEGDGLGNVRSSALNLRSLLAEDIEDEGPVPPPAAQASTGSADGAGWEEGYGVDRVVEESAVDEPAAMAKRASISSEGRDRDSPSSEGESPVEAAGQGGSGGDRGATADATDDASAGSAAGGRANEGERRAQEAERRAEEAQKQAEAAEARVREVELQLSDAEGLVAAAESRATVAERLTGEAEATSARAEAEQDAAPPTEHGCGAERGVEEEEKEKADESTATDVPPTATDSTTQTAPWDGTAEERAREAMDRAEREEARAEVAERKVVELQRWGQEQDARVAHLEAQATEERSKSAHERPGSEQGTHAAASETPREDEVDGLPMAFEPCRGARAQLAHLIHQLSAQERQLTKRFEQARREEADEAARQAARAVEEAAESDALRGQLARLQTALRRNKVRHRGKVCPQSGHCPTLDTVVLRDFSRPLCPLSAPVPAGPDRRPAPAAGGGPDGEGAGAGGGGPASRRSAPFSGGAAGGA